MTIARMIAVTAFVASAPLQAQRDYPPLHVDPTYKECSVKFAPELSQRAFHRFAREFGSVSAYKQGGPASTLGKGSVFVAVEMMQFPTDEWSPAWNDTFAHPHDEHPLGSTQSFPKLNVRVGLVDNVDVGMYYTRNPQSNYGWVGLDGKYRMFAESETTPVSLALRGAYTKTLYVKDMDMHTLTADVSVERRFWRVFRPYVGLGGDAVLVRETSNAVNLESENNIVPHVFGGFDVTLRRRVTIGAEFTRGAIPSAQVQVGAVLF